MLQCHNSCYTSLQHDQCNSGQLKQLTKQCNNYHMTEHTHVPDVRVWEFHIKSHGVFFLSVWYLCGYNDTFLIPLHTRSSYIKPISLLWGVTTVRNSASDFEGSLIISNLVWKHFRRMLLVNWIFFFFFFFWQDKSYFETQEASTFQSFNWSFLSLPSLLFCRCIALWHSE